VVFGHSHATDTLPIIKFSWPASEQVNPFSTLLPHYEVWHNGNLLTSIDETSVSFPLSKFPHLATGCIQIRQIVGDKASDFSDSRCYTYIDGSMQIVPQ